MVEVTAVLVDSRSRKQTMEEMAAVQEDSHSRRQTMEPFFVSLPRTARSRHALSAIKFRRNNLNETETWPLKARKNTWAIRAALGTHESDRVSEYVGRLHVDGHR
jgi:hypothetical protein